MIAALFVAGGGIYFNAKGVDPWDREREARNYRGPFPVVAHPPCQRWGRYWHTGGNKKGDDGGCFWSALTSVRLWGGVLEHPEGSSAWAKFGIRKPPRDGGWIMGDRFGLTCCVEQGHYGHRARKATWLYVSRAGILPTMKWGPSVSRLEVELMTKTERTATPEQFRDLLVSIAKGCES